MADITGIITVVDFFTFYQLVLDGHTIHLSFTEKKHRKAVKQLQKLSRQIDYLPQRQMSAGELAAMLSRQRSFAEFGQSTFIQAGTVFQQQVWQLISRIPFGETRTYGDLAKRLGNPMLSRAVGQACGANPVALLIPCHRVVGHAGLGGFGGGIELKKKLLDLEKR